MKFNKVHLLLILIAVFLVFGFLTSTFFDTKYDIFLFVCTLISGAIGVFVAIEIVENGKKFRKQEGR